MGQMTEAPPLQLIVGPAGHGVVAYAADVASELRTVSPETEIVRTETAAEAMSAARAVPRVHVHVTDRLFGHSPEEAAQNLGRLAEKTRLTITLHDLPQDSDGSSMARRVRAYARFLEAARAAAVNSRHEQHLVADFLPGSAAPHAIPLGARLARTPPISANGGGAAAVASASRDLVILVAGYVYPGKGHAQAIRAAAEAAGRLRLAGEPVGAVVVRAIGGSSPGHEGDVGALRAAAERQGVSFEVTGFLDENRFAGRIREHGIPLAAHEHVSASRSMLDWVEAGRRPLVVASRYAEEMDSLRPGTITLYEPDDLSRRVVEAWRMPERTWLEAGVELAPTLSDVAAEYAAWWKIVNP